MKGQIAISDMIVASFIFVILFGALLVGYNNSLKNLDSSIEFEDMINANFIVADQLVRGQGYPNNWNLTNVEVIGLADGSNYTLSENKVNNFKNLDYGLAKSLMNIKKFEFLFRIRAINNTILEETGLVVAGNRSVVNSRRYAFYNGEETIVEFTLWQ